MNAQRVRWQWMLFIGSLAGLALVGIGAVLGAYLSFKYPIKWDRYQHRFSSRTRLLQQLASEFDSDARLMLAAYNAGSRAVKRYGGDVPKYRETQDYVRQVGAIHALCRAQPATFLSTSTGERPVADRLD